MKGIIIYTSKYDTTKNYASWISEETTFETVNIKNLNFKSVEDADVVIIGSPVMAHKPKLSRWIEKNWHSLKTKKIYLFTTSGAPSSDPALFAGYMESLSEEILKYITYYPLSGRMIYSKLTAMDKLLMRIGQIIEKDQIIKKKMLEDVDGIKRGEIYPLVNDVHRYIESSKKAS